MVVGGVEYLRVRVRGGSFLLNQIRLMVGAALAVARGVLPDWLLAASLSKEPTVAVAGLPLAPPEGLVLVDASFDRFNQKKLSFQGAAPSPFRRTRNSGSDAEEKRTNGGQTENEEEEDDDDADDDDETGLVL